MSPRSVGKYLRLGATGAHSRSKAALADLVRNHAQVIVACDFFVAVTATFRTLYVFVIMDLGTRRDLHHNVTAHPTAEWTMQQFREALPDEHAYRFVIHDGDSIFSKELDNEVTAMGVRVLKNSGETAQGQFTLRAIRRDTAPRMSGLPGAFQQEA